MAADDGWEDVVMRALIFLLILLTAAPAFAGPGVRSVMRADNKPTHITSTFETGFDGWTVSGSVTRTTDDSHPSGGYAVRIPGGSAQYIYKTFTHSAAGTISFWHDFTGNGDFLWDVTYTGGSAGNTISGSGSWVQVTLGPYPAGTTTLQLTYEGGSGYDVEVDTIRYPAP